VYGFIKVYFTLKKFVLDQKSIKLTKHFTDSALRPKEHRSDFYKIWAACSYEISHIPRSFASQTPSKVVAVSREKNCEKFCENFRIEGHTPNKHNSLLACHFTDNFVKYPEDRLLIYWKTCIFGKWGWFLKLLCEMFQTKSSVNTSMGSYLLYKLHEICVIFSRDTATNFGGVWDAKLHEIMRYFVTARCPNFVKLIFVFSGFQSATWKIFAQFYWFLIENEFFECKIHFDRSIGRVPP